MRTKTIFLIYLILTVSSYGQNLIEKYPNIEKIKIQIDQNDSLNKIILENQEFLKQMTDGGGELKGFYDQNGIIKKIEVLIFQSTGIQEYDFYLKDENPVLIIDRFKQFAWDEKLNQIDYNKFDGGFYGTFIFRDNHLIDHISVGHNRFEDDQIDIEHTFLSEFSDYIDLIKKRLANND